MNTTELKKLADAYADAVAAHRLESLYGTSKSYTLEKARERDEAHEALVAAIEAQGVPDGWIDVLDAFEKKERSPFQAYLAAGLVNELRTAMLASAPPAPQAAKCQTCNDNGLIGGPSFYAPDEGGAPCPECSQASVVQQEPIGFISPKQVELIGDPECEFGKYIPMRKTTAGNFTLALYTHPAPQAKPQPLSAERIKSAIYKQCPDFDEWHEGPSIDDVIAIVKAAHGITKE